MIKETKYIIRRVIIGFLIAILVMFFKSFVFAETGIQTTNLNFTGNTFNRNVRIYSNSDNIFSNWGRSFISFNLMVQTTDPNATLYPIEQVSVFSSNNIYVCNIGNTNLNLSQGSATILVYDVACDTNIGVNGIQAIDVTFYQTDGVYPLHITSSQYMTIYQNLDLNISQVLQQQQAITQGYLNTIHSSIDLNGQYIVSAIQAMQTQQIQAINSQTQQQHSDAQAQKDATDNINNSINDSSTDNPSSSLNDMNSQIADNNVISDLLTLPIRFYQTILNSVGASCTPYNLGKLFNTDIVLPCKNIEDLLGSGIVTIIDTGLCGLFVFTIRKKFVNIFENITSLKDRGNELE